MVQGNLEIHTENILPIIKKWLYSSKDIFVRELASNGCDAISKLKGLTGGVSNPRIDITTNSTAKTLTVGDNGIGMTAEEVKKYIAQIAFSGAEEFLNTCQSGEEKDQIIGHFGLGFYSAYMVASKVEVHTLSYQEGSLPVIWSCSGSTHYDIEAGHRQTQGTDVILHIESGEEEFLEEGVLRQVLKKYCAFLPFPLFLNGVQVNTQPALWLKNPSECIDAEYIEFYRTLYPADQEPPFWIHLNVDYPIFLKGILYFPKVAKRFEWTRNQIKLFCNRVFVADNCSEIIPEFLSTLKGVVDCPSLPLNVSRSQLQNDASTRQLGAHIARKVADKLSSLRESQETDFIAMWADVETPLKLGCMQDVKFYEKAKKALLWKSDQGKWTTIEDYLERHKEAYSGKVYYLAETKLGSPVLPLFQAQGIEVLSAGSLIDPMLLSSLEMRLNIQCVRIDGEVGETLLDRARETSVVDLEGKTVAMRMAHSFSTLLEQAGLDLSHLAIEAKSLSSDQVPALLIVDEQQRRSREAHVLTQSHDAHEAIDKIWIVNTNHPLIQKMYALEDADLAHTLYGLTALAHNEIQLEEIGPFIQSALLILNRLAVQQLQPQS